MSTERKSYGVSRTEAEEPIEFELTDDDGESLGVFHVARKPRLDLIQAMARAVTLDKGVRVYDINILTYVIRELLVEELYDREHKVWRQADDLARFDRILKSDRIKVHNQTLGEIAMDLMNEITDHPTGASGPSSAGRTTNGSMLKVDFDSPD